MIKIYFRTLLVSWKIYGFGKVFLTQLLVEPFMRLFAFLTLFLDNIFFPGYSKVKVESPIFIMGHPRSGTTFLHHLLTSTDNAVAFHTWHLLFPALTARALVRPLIETAIKKGKAEVMPEWTGHKMALDKTEEEEMLFLHNYDTQFVPVGLLGFDDHEYPDLQLQDQQPRKHRMHSMDFLDGCFKRHMHYTGKTQVIAQTHFSTHRIKTMLEYYPDAKFIFILRDPQHVVPSYLSLLTNSIKFRWGLEKIPEDVLHRYYQRRYQAIVDLYRYFHDLHKNNELPADRVLVLPYDLLVKDLVGAFDKVVSFTGVSVSESFLDSVAQRSKKQKSYKRRHNVFDLETFHLNKEKIEHDFSFVYKGFGGEKE